MGKFIFLKFNFYFYFNFFGIFIEYFIKMIKLYPSIPFIFLTLNIFVLDKSALMLNNQNMGENLWKKWLTF